MSQRDPVSNPARGCLIGTAISIALWSLIGVALYSCGGDQVEPEPEAYLQLHLQGFDLVPGDQYGGFHFEGSLAECSVTDPDGNTRSWEPRDDALCHIEDAPQ